MNTTAIHVDEKIAAFASAVRAALRDLPADDVDELVDGLEADLADQTADQGEAFELGDPEAYAAELRAAAGLPERAKRATAQTVSVGALWRGIRTWLTALFTVVRSNPVGGWLVDTLIALRPVWWLARGWAIYLLFGLFLRPDARTNFLPIDNPFGWAILIAATVLSIQWGRARWVGTRLLRGVRVAVSIACLVAVPVGLAAAANRIDIERAEAAATAPEKSTPGLAIDGERIRNIFAYDLNGKPLENVQLFDQNGRPLNVVGKVDPDQISDPYFFGGGGPATVPYKSNNSLQRFWNVYPLRELSPESQYGDDLERAVKQALVPKPPLAEVAPVVLATPEPAPTPTGEANATPGATPSATAGTAPDATPAATPVPTATPAP